MTFSNIIAIHVVFYLMDAQCICKNNANRICKCLLRLLHSLYIKYILWFIHVHSIHQIGKDNNINQMMPKMTANLTFMFALSKCCWRLVIQCMLFPLRFDISIGDWTSDTQHRFVNSSRDMMASELKGELGLFIF